MQFLPFCSYIVKIVAENAAEFGTPEYRNELPIQRALPLITAYTSIVYFILFIYVVLSFGIYLILDLMAAKPII